MSVKHVGRLVFVREEMLNGLEKVAHNLYTADWLDALNANGELDQPPPPPGPPLPEGAVGDPPPPLPGVAVVAAEVIAADA